MRKHAVTIHHVSSAASIAALFASPHVARAQCQDWLPGQPAGIVSGDFRAGVLFDSDADGPLAAELLVAGDFSFPSSSGSSIDDLAAWNGVSWRRVIQSFLPISPRALTTFDFDGPGPLPPRAVVAGQFSLPGGRVEMVQHGRLSVLNDCYNANPQSFRAAIALAAALRADRRLVFVAGTMRELGDREAALHVEVAGELAALNPELLVAVGAFGPALAGHAAHFGSRLLVAPDAPTAGPMLAPLLRGDELVVLKASRGVALERILPAITPRALPLH